jgi:hypothetical protein
VDRGDRLHLRGRGRRRLLPRARATPPAQQPPLLRRTLKAVRLLARDGGLPRWLRGLAAVGLAPIPGPFDEVVLLVVAAILWLGYRDRLRAAWRDAA